MGLALTLGYANPYVSAAGRTSHLFSDCEPSASCIRGNRKRTNLFTITKPDYQSHGSSDTPALSVLQLHQAPSSLHYHDVDSSANAVLLWYSSNDTRSKHTTRSFPSATPLVLPAVTPSPTVKCLHPALSPRQCNFFHEYKSAALCPCSSCVLGRTAEERGRLCSKVHPTRPPRPAEPAIGSPHAHNPAALPPHKSTTPISSSKVRTRDTHV